jgi:hypothetical protein
VEIDKNPLTAIRQLCREVLHGSSEFFQGLFGSLQPHEPARRGSSLHYGVFIALSISIQAKFPPAFSKVQGTESLNSSKHAEVSGDSGSTAICRATGRSSFEAELLSYDLLFAKALQVQSQEVYGSRSALTRRVTLRLISPIAAATDG